MDSTPKKAKLVVKEENLKPEEDSPLKLPPLVAAILIRTVEDVSVLKTWRLVCKSWNAEACMALRTRSFVLMNEYDSDMVWEFKNMLSNRAIGPLSNQLSPFMNFRVIAETLEDVEFYSVISLPSTNITHLCINVSDQPPLDVTVQRLVSLFEFKKRNMIKLSIRILPSGQEILLFEQSTNQKRLSLIDSCFPYCAHAGLFGVCLQGLSLNVLQIRVYDPHICTVFHPENLHCVKELEIATHSGAGAEVAWNSVAACHMPSLQTLTLKIPFMFFLGGHSAPFVANSTPVIRNSATSIEELNVISCKVNMLPILPKLRKLSALNWEDELGLLSPKKFPALEHVTMGISSHAHKFENSFDPHPGVKSVRIEWKDYVNDYFLHVFLGYLRQQFPNTFALDFKKTRLTLLTLLSIQSAFPLLKKMRIRGSCDFAAMTGMDADTLNAYVVNGWPIASLPQFPSLLSFKELESLMVEKVTNEMITYCISRISTLKSVTFHWNAELSVQVVRDCLFHLKNITALFHDSNAGFQEIKTQLQQAIPHITILT